MLCIFYPTLTFVSSRLCTVISLIQSSCPSIPTIIPGSQYHSTSQGEIGVLLDVFKLCNWQIIYVVNQWIIIADDILAGRENERGHTRALIVCFIAVR